MEQDIARRPDPDVADGEAESSSRRAADADDNHDDKRDARLTRRVHVVLGLVIAGLGAWLLYKSRTELAFRGPNNEPGPGYLPVLLTSCLIALGLALAAVWLFGAEGAPR